MEKVKYSGECEPKTCTAYKLTMNKNIIYELRVVCRSDGKKKYPFQIYTDAKYYYTEFDEAEAAVQRMVKEYLKKIGKRYTDTASIPTVAKRR